MQVRSRLQMLAALVLRLLLRDQLALVVTYILQQAPLMPAALRLFSQKQLLTQSLQKSLRL